MPPNWDSWGKIRVLREGFDVEAVNKGWSLDIEESFNAIPTDSSEGAIPSIETANLTLPGGAVQMYEDTIRDPSLDALQTTTAESKGLKLEVSSLAPQVFLASQVEVLDKIRQDTSGLDTSSRIASGSQRSISGSGFEPGADDTSTDEGRVNEHIGPVQFNMGGIQVDADDMLQRLKVKPFPQYTDSSILTNMSRIDKPTKRPNQQHQDNQQTMHPTQTVNLKTKP